MKPIFHDNYPQNCYSIVNQHNYAVLVALAGSDASKVSCLAPECSSNMRQFEKKKAMWVHLLINALNAGISLDSLPDGCTCDELACACSDIVLSAQLVESGKVNLTVVTADGGAAGNEDLTVTVDGVATVIATADQPGSTAFGFVDGHKLEFALPVGGTAAVSAIALTALSINGDAVDLADGNSADQLFANIDVAGETGTIFFPPINGVTSFEVTITLA
jgi:hypothetical protein